MPPTAAPRAWLLRPAGPVTVAFLVAVLPARAARVAVASARGGMDNAFVVHAGQVWLDGGAPTPVRHGSRTRPRC
ncbi:hypothetical protein ACFYNZ_23175 [Streptomyces kebangsaanensis]|uniref:Uncharacterized protein n=1 Tax=Streptomyces kebangsaanensis TaxID=864058 RepID=A0ABW6KWX0_9ACTN